MADETQMMHSHERFVIPQSSCCHGNVKEENRLHLHPKKNESKAFNINNPRRLLLVHYRPCFGRCRRWPSHVDHRTCIAPPTASLCGFPSIITGNTYSLIIAFRSFCRRAGDCSRGREQGRPSAQGSVRHHQ